MGGTLTEPARQAHPHRAKGSIAAVVPGSKPIFPLTDLCDRDHHSDRVWGRHNIIGGRPAAGRSAG